MHGLFGHTLHVSLLGWSHCPSDGQSTNRREMIPYLLSLPKTKGAQKCPRLASTIAATSELSSNFHLSPRSTSLNVFDPHHDGRGDKDYSRYNNNESIVFPSWAPSLLPHTQKTQTQNTIGATRVETMIMRPKPSNTLSMLTDRGCDEDEGRFGPTDDQVQ